MTNKTSALLCFVLASAASAQDDVNAKISSAYSVTRFDKRLGSASTQIDPYAGGGIAVTHALTFEGPDAVEREPRLYRVSARMSARLDAAHAVQSWTYDYRFLDRTFSASFRPDQGLVLSRNGEARRVEIPAGARLALSLEVGFLQLAQANKLNEPEHKLLLVLPTDRELVLREVAFRVVGPETRRYADQLLAVTHLVVSDPPECFSVRDFYVDRYGRLVEWTAVDDTRLALERETQFSKMSKPVESWYKAVRVVPQNQQERTIGFSRSAFDPAALTYAAERRIKRVILDVVGESSETWSAELTRSWQLESFRYRRSSAGERLDAVYQSMNRRLTYDGQPPLDLPADRPFVGTLELAGVVLAQREELLTSRIHHVTVLDPDRRGVRNVTLVVKGPLRRDYFVPNVYVIRVQVAVDRDIVAEMYLDKYGRALEISETDGLRTIACAGKHDLDGPTPAADRRDPFKRPVKAELTEDEMELAELGRRFVLLRDHWDRRGPADVGYDSFKAASDAFFEQLSVYRRALAGKEEDAFVVLWEEEAKRWTLEMQSLLRPQVRHMKEFLRELHLYKDAVKRRDLEAAREIARRIASMPLSDQTRAMWESVRHLVADLACERALERLDIQVSSIAWELDYVRVPVCVRLSLMGGGVAFGDSILVARVRAYCLMNRGLYRAGDSFEFEGVTLTVLRIEKDKVTIGAGALSKDFLLR